MSQFCGSIFFLRQSILFFRQFIFYFRESIFFFRESIFSSRESSRRAIECGAPITWSQETSCTSSSIACELFPRIGVEVFQKGR